MSSLIALGAGHGFTAGDLDTDGLIAVVPAYQSIYFADGRAYSNNGYHKLDFIDTKLSGVASGSFTKGEEISQAVTSATGIFYESVGNEHFVYRTTTTEFDTSNVCVGADSGETLTPTAVTAPPHWLDWVPEQGILPAGGATIGALSFGKVFLNDVNHPNQWSASRNGNPLDWLMSQSDVGTPVSSQTSKAGLVGSPITCFSPYKDRFMIVGCLNELWVMRGDPAAGGTLTNMSQATGIFDGTAYCWDDKNNYYFLGTDGVYAISSAAVVEAGTPENITKENIPKLLKSLGINRRTDRIAMAFDKQRYGVTMTVSTKDGSWHSSWWIDIRAGGIYPEAFASDQIPASAAYFDARIADERGLLIGGQDGYVRKFDETKKSDDDNETIESYVAVGPVAVGKNARDQVIAKEISVETSADSDEVEARIYVGKTSEDVINLLNTSATPKIVKTLGGKGLRTSIRNRAKGGAIAVMLANANFGESFSIEDIQVNLTPSGRRK
jgi:hypothetical protein